MHEILREIDTNMNGQVELDEYLQVGIEKANTMKRNVQIELKQYAMTIPNRNGLIS